MKYVEYPIFTFIKQYDIVILYNISPAVSSNWEVNLR